jgi:hypothetical protein
VILGESHEIKLFNEFGRDITVFARLEPIEGEYLGNQGVLKRKPGVLFGLSGPDSEHSNHITMREARALHRALGAVLREEEDR